jgi:hypothetical protein
LWRWQSWPIGSISHFMKLDQYDSDEEAFNRKARRQTVEMEMADVATIRVQVCMFVCVCVRVCVCVSESAWLRETAAA